MLGAAALLAISMVLTNAVHNLDKRGEIPNSPGSQAAPDDAASKAAREGDRVEGGNAFALVFKDRYLLLIGLLMLVYNLVNTNGEYILGRTVVELYTASHGAAMAGGLDEKKIIGEFYGNFFTIVNVLSAVLQAFVVSRVLRYFGVRGALLVLPAVALIGYSAMAVLPVLAYIRTVKMAENSLDYSLQSTTKNALYLPTSRAAKYKAKQANDTFFVRFGDLLSAGLVFAGTTWLGFATRHFALVNVGLIVLWLVIAILIGKTFRRLAGSS